MAELLNNEVIEMGNEVEVIEMDDCDYTEGSGNGKAIVATVGAIGAAAALVAVAYKKIKKSKEGDKKPRKRKKLMWVEVEDEVAEDVDVDEIEVVIEDDEE